jgi:flagellar FliL protein
MAEETKSDTPSAEHAEAPKKKGGAAIAFALPIVTAALAAGGAYGGSILAGAAPAGGGHGDEAKLEQPTVHLPGPTVPMDPFIASVADANQRRRTMKLTIAVELHHTGNPDEFKVFVPRIRDAILSYLRGRTYEEMTTPDGLKKAREDIIDLMRKEGAISAEHLLITDFVMQ